MNGSLESSLKYKKATQGGDAIIRYVDADYAGNVDTRKSLSRYVFTLFAMLFVGKQTYIACGSSTYN